MDVKLIFLLLILPLGLANPTINSATGDFSDNGEVIIYGSGFGAKSQAPPKSWLGGQTGNIEKGIIGSQVSASGYSVTVAGDTGHPAIPPRYSTADAHSYSKSIDQWYSGGQYDNGLVFDGATNSAYTTFWAKLWIDPEIKNLCNPLNFQIKWTRFYDNCPGVKITGANTHVMRSSHWYLNSAMTSKIRYPQLCTENVSYSEYPQYPGRQEGYWNGLPFQAIENKWMRFEGFYQRNSGDDEADGIFTEGWLGYMQLYDKESNSDILTHSSTTIPCCGEPGNYDRIVLPFFLGSYKPRNCLSNDKDNIHLYIDDIYIDSTRSRVELCNFDQWTKKWDPESFCEVQPAETWSSNQVRIRLNTASFKKDDIAFLYIVDSNGDASNSEKIIIGDTAECLPDCAGRECGSDGCGGTCAPGCSTDETCDNGQCTCNAHSYSSCDNGNIYWFDSCDNREELLETCVNGCSGSTCNTDPVEICDNLVMLHRFDYSSAVQTDASGSGNDATVNGATWSGDRQSYSFDGNDLITVSDFSYGPQYSISFWFKASTGTGNAMYILSHDGYNYPNSFNAALDTDGSLLVCIRDSNDGTCGGSTLTAAGLDDGQWHHIAVTVLGNSILYVDGSQVASLARGGDSYNPSTDIFLGQSSVRTDRAFRGQIDDVAIWNRALSAQEIAEIESGVNCGCITLSELISLLEDWKAGQSTMQDILAGIQEWKNGC